MIMRNPIDTSIFLKSEEIVADVESARRQLIFYLLDLITLRFWLFLKL
ncbi:hypothetical protein BBM1128_06135 [Bifidobacterium breve MCC 1128]|uniref:Uncharacterized protein n=1 Tax=Bifidobacterium breve MCC 1128 TaxID=1365965 RepID=A0A0L7AYR6_BIFBR|nr:hypothetical protein BBM1128_06135 [Bifidobacterium breve MCC 1128]